MYSKVLKIILYLGTVLMFVQILQYDEIFNRVKQMDEMDEFNITIALWTRNVSKNYSKYYLTKYPFLLKCDIEYKSKTKENEPIEPELYEQRITRAILFYYPLLKNKVKFMKEFKWVYRSWIEMQKYEPSKWRTDLVIFLDNKANKEKYKQFEDLNCTFINTRKTNTDEPMCSLVPYVPLENRTFEKVEPKFASFYEEYQYLYSEINIFNHDGENLNPFYQKLKTIGHYGYVDSILMAFDGYNYLKDKYHYLIRSDMDVFFTPLFAKWLPKNCNDFVVGGGGYSNQFNMRKLRKIATYLKLEYKDIWNFGSTWFSTPKQFCLVSYLTLVSMVYLSNEEFTSVERKGELGTLNWPDWHYGVLLLYGQNLAMNHLIATNQTYIAKYTYLIDYPSYESEDVSKIIHIHVYHQKSLFSKYSFYDGLYDNETVPDDKRNITKYYCLHLALESKRLNATSFLDLASMEIKKKT